jgi:hypothetical protein
MYDLVLMLLVSCAYASQRAEVVNRKVINGSQHPFTCSQRSFIKVFSLAWKNSENQAVRFIPA